MTTATRLAEFNDIAATVDEVVRLRDEVARLREANDTLAAERARVGIETVIVRSERDQYVEALRRIRQWREDDPFAVDPAHIAHVALTKPVTS